MMGMSRVVKHGLVEIKCISLESTLLLPLDNEARDVHILMVAFFLLIVVLLFDI